MQSVVNTAESTIFSTKYSGGLNEDRQGLISCRLRKKTPEETWGFRLQGGKDRGLPFQIVKVRKHSDYNHWLLDLKKWQATEENVITI